MGLISLVVCVGLSCSLSELPLPEPSPPCERSAALYGGLKLGQLGLPGEASFLYRCDLPASQARPPTMVLGDPASPASRYIRQFHAAMLRHSAVTAEKSGRNAMAD